MYFSTRSDEKVTSSQAIIKGLAFDGGLYIFDKLPKLRFNSSMIKLSYNELAKLILKEFLDDFTEEEISYCVDRAYTKDNYIPNMLSFDLFESFGFLNLYNGPTFAFKDMALQILPYLLSVAKKKNNIKEHTVILTATSGDTGSAALSGFSTLDDISCIVLYPNGSISQIQELQMLSFNNNKSKSIAVNGNFDDCQKAVKDIFNSVSIEGVSLSSANSINIGRLIPQVVYYVYAYSYLVNNNKIKYGEKINISVPTGNFGNILACYIAKLIGTPIDKIICSSNKNNVLTDFFNTGIYNSKREFYVTNSPSMDILISSNLERFLYLTLNDKYYISKLMNDLNTKGFYQLDEKYLSKINTILSSYATEEEIEDCIKDVYNNYHILIDPHTSVAYKGYLDHKDDNFTLCISTASPFKFSKTISSSLKYKLIKDEFENIEYIFKKTNIKPDNRILKLKDTIINRIICNKEDIKTTVLKLIGEYND